METLLKQDQHFPGENSRTPVADLISRATDGDKEAFGDLYERYLDNIYRYIFYRVSGDQYEAEDLTEMVFLKAWKALASYQAGSVPFLGWLYRIAHNLVIDNHRHLSLITQVPLDGQYALSDNDHSPEEELARQENVHAVVSAMARLRDSYREILTLRFISQLNYSEVGQIMERSEAAVRVLQFRALKALRDQLEGEKSQ